MKKCTPSTILLGLFMAPSALYWLATCGVLVLHLVGYAERFYYYGYLYLDALFFLVAVVQLLGFVVLIILFCSAKEERQIKKWKQIGGIIIVLSYLFLVVAHLSVILSSHLGG